MRTLLVGPMPFVAAGGQQQQSVLRRHARQRGLRVGAADATGIAEHGVGGADLQCIGGVERYDVRTDLSHAVMVVGDEEAAPGARGRTHVAGDVRRLKYRRAELGGQRAAVRRWAAACSDRREPYVFVEAAAFLPHDAEPIVLRQVRDTHAGRGAGRRDRRQRARVGAVRVHALQVDDGVVAGKHTHERDSEELRGRVERDIRFVVDGVDARDVGHGPDQWIEHDRIAGVGDELGGQCQFDDRTVVSKFAGDRRAARVDPGDARDLHAAPARIREHEPATVATHGRRQTRVDRISDDEFAVRQRFIEAPRQRDPAILHVVAFDDACGMFVPHLLANESRCGPGCSDGLAP